MIYSREEHIRFLEEELRAQTEAYKNRPILEISRRRNDFEIPKHKRNTKTRLISLLFYSSKRTKKLQRLGKQNLWRFNKSKNKLF